MFGYTPRLTFSLFFLCLIPNLKLLKQLTMYQQVAISQKKPGIEWITFYNYIHKAQECYCVLVVLCTRVYKGISIITKSDMQCLVDIQVDPQEAGKLEVYSSTFLHLNLAVEYVGKFTIKDSSYFSVGIMCIQWPQRRGLGNFMSFYKFLKILNSCFLQRNTSDTVPLLLGNFCNQNGPDSSPQESAQLFHLDLLLVLQ